MNANEANDLFIAQFKRFGNQKIFFHLFDQQIPARVPAQGITEASLLRQLISASEAMFTLFIAGRYG